MLKSFAAGVRGLLQIGLVTFSFGRFAPRARALFQTGSAARVRR